MWIVPGLTLTLSLMPPVVPARGPHVDATGILIFCSSLVLNVASGSVCIAWLVWKRGRGWFAYLGLLFILGWSFAALRSIDPTLRHILFPGRYTPRELDPKTGEPLSQ